MGVYSEMDIDRMYGENPFTDDTEQTPVVLSTDTATQTNVAHTPTTTVPDSIAKTPAEDAAEKNAAETALRKEHEESEAKRKADWEAKRKEKLAEEERTLTQLGNMSDDDVLIASIKRISTALEQLTRRNMKECVAEHIQTQCLEDPTFARRTMHPRKNMVHCIWYINRKAKEYLQKELENNQEKPDANGVFGGDVPDELCYQWAVDYFNDPNAEEDIEKEEKFVPKPYIGSSSSSKTKKKELTKKTPPKVPEKKSESKKASDTGQMSLGDFTLPEASA